MEKYTRSEREILMAAQKLIYITYSYNIHNIYVCMYLCMTCIYLKNICVYMYAYAYAYVYAYMYIPMCAHI